ncbi:MAG: acetate--CoA ligase [Dehalococcoidia bacterium]|jgi:acetyl-CoA synthetase|nr:acetate--CoA ligase [Dehalococcoidia bacterium]MDP6226224.1 acetate--CoA ligase [Dehalococcoidia bacterium]MDP7084425.1 acetate--CoA ligase [Dehalococcoidia bacterium]MDP7200930.1 acetate--CoA ligase [Dehalococcoidia bacterium]MDP7510130.1 acetate--CoA ligase [Dehalococcoidia bacterium]
MVEMSGEIEALLQENRTFPPPEEFRNQANISDPNIYEDARKDPEGFWAGFAEELSWIRKWDQVLEWDPPHAKWFDGGQLNVSYNCIDRHLTSARRNKAALIWEGEPGDWRVYTYWDLYREVCRFANGLKSLGVKKGERVTIYMPMVPELPIAMLACARIGAPHSVIFGGFSAESIRDRINDSESKVLITADGGYRRGNIVQLKQNADEALEGTPGVEKVVMLRRTGHADDKMVPGRDIWWHDLVDGQSMKCDPEPMESEDMLFLLYTSGTTGKPKGIVHTTAGYLLGTYATTKWIFDLKENDTYWCTADIGWITGHSYIVYGPLANGATTVMYEGTPDHPDRDRFWAIVAKYGVTIVYTAPTAIRTFMRWGEEYPQRHDLSTLRLLGTVGEPINPEAWIWYWQNIGQGRCPVVDTWWQTETGMVLITPLPGITTQKPGSATKPFPGIEAEVVDESGNPVGPGAGGYLVIKGPWPAMLRTIYGDPDRYVEQYWSRYPNIYFTADGARMDTDGDFWLLGRVDDVINVSAHRISTMEVESALVDNPKVAEAACIGKSHEIKGQAIVAFVTVKDKVVASDELVTELKQHVTTKIGPMARPDDIFFTAELPKTRSGKIMRRLLRDVAEGRALGDTTTLADPAVVESLKQQYGEEE